MRSFASLVAALAAVLICGISQAEAAVTIEREVPVDILNKPYTVAQDGSVWTTYSTSSSSGVITHLDGQNGSILASFNIAFNGYDHPQSIGYANNRVYIVQTPSIYSFRVDGPSGTTNPGLAFSDGETANRLGSNQAFLRVGSDGTGTVALGQTGSVGVLDLNDVTAPSFYPQTFYRPTMGGGGVHVCHVDSPPAAPGCDNGAGAFNYATDTAPDGDNGFYVTEYSGNQVTHVTVSLSGYTISSFGSGPGPAAGQLDSPASIRRIPDTGRLVISNPPNRRLDEFSPTGDYERSYGFGVLTGADEFETCGVGIGTCDAGIPYASDSRSYFTQLDIVDGKLYAGTPLDHSIQVINLGTDGGGGTPPGGDTPPGGGDTPPGGGRTGSLDLKADPVKIEKNKKATLTAKLENCEDGDSVSFQRKAGSAFDDLGSAVATNEACKAKKRVKIKDTSIFRAIALDSQGTSIATSPKVKVKLT